MATKTLEQMMGEMQDPLAIEKNAKYQNARDSVAWAWKIAQDKCVEVTDMTKVASYLIPMIEADLNRTLEVLK